jgi:hypothetical protein
MAAIAYQITNRGNTTLISLNFAFTTPVAVTLSANFSSIKSGEPTNFSGTNYTVTGLSIVPDASVVFYVDYLYLSGGAGNTYNGSVSVTGYSSSGQDDELISTEIIVVAAPVTSINTVPTFGQYFVESAPAPTP